MAEFIVELERDEDGRAWIARVPSVPGCHTHGRSIDQALNRTREALSLWIPKAEAAKADLVPEVRLPEAVKAELFELAAARERARSAQEEASSWLRTAVQDLTRREGLSVRDVARVVELSPQRVQQVSSSSEGGASSGARGRRVLVGAAKKTAATKRRTAGKKATR